VGSDKEYEEKIQDLDVGNLVTFCGYHYTPDFVIYDQNRDGTLGIVLRRLSSMGFKPNTMYRTYKIYWFKSKETTVEVRDHLRLVDSLPL
tara:strand:+ start:802 stop:1071 length:270 start_codon:yes stop_codon:yes gene_type:complete